jgi:hypothetical protein
MTVEQIRQGNVIRRTINDSLLRKALKDDKAHPIKGEEVKGMQGLEKAMKVIAVLDTIMLLRVSDILCICLSCRVKIDVSIAIAMKRDTTTTNARCKDHFKCFIYDLKDEKNKHVKRITRYNTLLKKHSITLDSDPNITPEV